MHSNFITIIENCFSDNNIKRKKSLIKFQKVLMEEINRAVGGLSSVIYKNNSYVIGKSYIEFYGIREGLEDGINELWLYLYEEIKIESVKYGMKADKLTLSKYKERYMADTCKTIINGLSSNKNKNFIISTFGQILTNTIFKDIINGYRRKRRQGVKHFNNEIKNMSSTEIFKLLSENDEIKRLFDHKEIALFATYCSINGKIETDKKEKLDEQNILLLKKKMRDNFNFSNNNEVEKINEIKKTIIRKYISKQKDISLDEIAINSKNIDYPSEDKLLFKEKLFEYFKQEDNVVRRNLQKKYYFWMPGTENVWQNSIPKELNSEMNIQDEPELPISIAFFYSWLLECSGISKKQIADIADIDLGTVYRWERNLSVFLKAPFIEENIFPVFFDSFARNQIGLNDQNIRVYSKKDITNKELNRERDKIKEVLWNIYDFVSNAVNYIDEIDKKKLGVVNKLPIMQGNDFDFCVCYLDEINEIDTSNSYNLRQIIVIIGDEK